MLSLTLFKIITVSRPSTLLRLFLMGDQDFPLRKELRGLHPHAQNFERHFWKSSLTRSQTTYRKKVSLVAFRQTLPKHFVCGAHFQFHIVNYFKKLIGIKSLNTKQYQSSFSSRIISPSYQKFPRTLILLCCRRKVCSFIPFL